MKARTFVHDDSTVRDPHELLSLLAPLAEQHAALELCAPGGISLRTEVLRIDEAARFLVLATSGDARLDEELTSGAPVNFSTRRGIPLLWTSRELRLVAPRRAAFLLPFPTTLERLQRRRYFRMPTLQSAHPVLCRIWTENGPIRFPVTDLSLCGLGLLVKGPLPAPFHLGATLTACTLESAAMGVLPVELKVCRVQSGPRPGGHGEQHRLGLELAELSACSEAVLVRYLIQLQRALIHVQ